MATKKNLPTLGKHFDTSIGPDGTTVTNPIPNVATGVPAAAGNKPALPDHKTGKVNLDGGTAPVTGEVLTPPPTYTQPTQHTAQQPPAGTVPAGNVQAESTKPTQSAAAYTYDPFSYADYVQSDAVKQASALLQQQVANKPGAYQSQWQDQIDAAFDAYTNRDPFSYDFNTDALYHQYKDNYIQQGRMAMMDTMGQAAAMTGGYGNSYAQSVGQQAYNQQLNQLNDVIPELRQMAYDQYEREGTNLYNQYNMLLAKENKDYARYQDNLSNWYKDLDYLTDRYDTESANDYNQYLTGRQNAWDEYAMQQERDMAAAEMMAALGDYDRLAQMYGLSASELAAIEKANAPKPVATGGKAYTKLTYGSDAYNSMIKEMERAGDIGQLQGLVDMYLGFGYDPNIINVMSQGYAGALTPQSTPVDTSVSKNGLPSVDELEKRRQSGNTQYKTIH